MKKIIFILIFCAAVYNVAAQTNFQENFLADEVVLYKGAKLKLKDNPITGMLHAFYSSLEDAQPYMGNKVIFPDSRYGFSTVPDSLQGKIYEVEEVIAKDGSMWDNSKASYADNPILILNEVGANKKIFFKYDPRYKHNFPFLVSGITYPPDYFCKKIERNIDEFTNEINIKSPTIYGENSAPIIIYKDIEKGKVKYYLRLDAQGQTVNIGEKGVIILFTDGTKLNKDTSIDVEVGSDGYFDYSAFMLISPAEVDLLSKKTIKKYRLYIYDQEVGIAEAERFKKYAECIKTSK